MSFVMKLAVLFWVASWLTACDAKHAAVLDNVRPPSAESPEPSTLELTVIHTADLHSHVFPERMLIGKADAARGLGREGEVASVGGFGRVATLTRGIRAVAARSLYLDSGDVIEGTDVFTAFNGEPELRVLSLLAPDAVALGNHDLAPGAQDFAAKHAAFAHFPVLAANYRASGVLAHRLDASVVLHLRGVRVGVIGVANSTSPPGVAQENNAYGIVVTPTAAAVQTQIDALRPQVDLVFAITHVGLAADEALISQTTGLDVVLGGHQHLAIDEPIERTDCGAALQRQRGCVPRRVTLVHSGANARYVGRLDLALSSVSVEGHPALTVSAAKHTLLPTSAEVASDPEVDALLEPYRVRLANAGFDRALAFALGPVERYGSDGGDSALGNLVADGMRERAHVDFAVINTTGIRADLPPGVLSKAAFASTLPFDDTLVRLSVTGATLLALLRSQARLAAERQCQSPIQISGFEATLVCAASGASARASINGIPLDPNARYTLVTTDYLADGGSGFGALSSALAREELEIEPLDVLLDTVALLPVCAASTLPCIDPSGLRDGRLATESR